LGFKMAQFLAAMYLLLSLCIALDLFHLAIAFASPSPWQIPNRLPTYRQFSQPRMSSQLRSMPAEIMEDEVCVPVDEPCGTDKPPCCDEIECKIHFTKRETRCIQKHEWNGWRWVLGEKECTNVETKIGTCQQPYCLSENYGCGNGFHYKCCEGLTCSRHPWGGSKLCRKPCVPLGEQRPGRCGQDGDCCKGSVCKNVPSLGTGGEIGLPVLGLECVKECSAEGYFCGDHLSLECCEGLSCTYMNGGWGVPWGTKSCQQPNETKPCVPLGETRPGRCGQEVECCGGGVCQSLQSVGTEGEIVEQYKCVYATINWGPMPIMPKINRRAPQSFRRRRYY